MPFRPPIIPPLSKPVQVVAPTPQSSHPRWMQLRESGVTHPEDILNQFGYSGPQTDLLGLAKYLGVDVRYVYEPTNWVGAVRTNETSATIFIVPTKPLVNQRFTLAHELGHLMLHPTGQTYRDLEGHPSYDESEKQVNDFALNILMPEKEFRTVLSKVCDLGQVANVFGVGEVAAKIRSKWPLQKVQREMPVLRASTPASPPQVLPKAPNPDKSQMVWI